MMEAFRDDYNRMAIDPAYMVREVNLNTDGPFPLDEHEEVVVRLYALDTSRTERCQPHGSNVAYELLWNGEVIFKGDDLGTPFADTVAVIRGKHPDYEPSELHKFLYSDDAVLTLLSFMSYDYPKPEDEQAEEFVDFLGEEVQMYVMQMRQMGGEFAPSTWVSVLE